MPSLNRTVAVGLLALLLGFGLRGACRPPQPVEPVAVARSDSLDATKPDYARERDSLALVVQHATDAARRAKREADRLRARAVPNSGTNAPKEGISDTLSDTLVARWRFDTLAAAYDSLAVAYQRTDSARGHNCASAPHEGVEERALADSRVAEKAHRKVRGCKSREFKERVPFSIKCVKTI